MNWADEICVSCGLCCTTLSIVRITPADIERLMRGYGLAREQAERMIYRREGELRILMDKSAACPALSSNAGRYLCHAYEHRPNICREYECYILAGARDWLRKKLENLPVEEPNPFHSAADETELARKVQDSIRTMRGNYLNLCVAHQNDTEGFRKPDYISKLIELLSGAGFPNSFPSPAEPPLNPAAEKRPAAQ